jgi:hypothetical protein
MYDEGHQLVMCLLLRVSPKEQAMMIREHKFLLTATILSSLFAAPAPAFGQWIHYEKKNVPRLPDGKVNMTAPAPKQADGTPDLSGIWLGDNWGPAGARPNPPSRNVQTSKMLPAAQKEFDARMANSMLNDPKVRCLPNGVPHANTEPYPFEIVHAPGKTLILYEMYSLRRQIFTDGRKLPQDIKQFTPTWMGYSVGRWEGDEFVVDTTGFNDRVWPIDMGAHPSSDALFVTERFKRVDFGHMDLSVTIDDPKTYESKWTQPYRYTLLPDTDLLEFICENNPSPLHMVGK